MSENAVPRSRAEIAETLKMIDALELQCVLQRNKAMVGNDIQTTWMMENQRVNFAICRQSIKWALGLTNTPAFDSGTVGQFLTEGIQG